MIKIGERTVPADARIWAGYATRLPSNPACDHARERSWTGQSTKVLEDAVRFHAYRGITSVREDLLNG